MDKIVPDVNYRQEGVRIGYTERRIVGNAYTGGIHAKIVRVVDTGRDDDFEWLINNRNYKIKNGDIVLFSLSDIRMPIVKHKPSDVRIQIISFPLYVLFPGTELVELYYSGRQINHIPAEKAQAVFPDFDKFISEIQHNDRYSESSTVCALRLLVTNILRLIRTEYGDDDSSENTSVHSAHMTLIGNVLTYLHANLSGHLTLAETAAHFNVSESLLSKLFRSMVGMTFPEYIRRLRINRVLENITRNGMGILDAALESGFKSVSGFYKSFSEVTGKSPTEYLRGI